MENIISIIIIAVLILTYVSTATEAFSTDPPENKYRAEVSYGTVLQDPFIRKDDNTIPLIYYDRHLTEQMIQREKYIPNRIRPPNGPIFWHNNEDSELKRIFDHHNVSMSERYNIIQRLGMPNITS